MLTQRELQNLIDQVNKSFAEDRKKIKALEDKVEALEASQALLNSMLAEKPSKK